MEDVFKIGDKVRVSNIRGTTIVYGKSGGMYKYVGAIGIIENTKNSNLPFDYEVKIGGEYIGFNRCELERVEDFVYEIDKIISEHNMTIKDTEILGEFCDMTNFHGEHLKIFLNESLKALHQGKFRLDEVVDCI